VSAPQLLGLYRFTFGTLIAIASAQTLFAARADHGMALLAAAEIAGALSLCWRRTQWLGAALLLGVFACAQIFSALQGEWPTRFVLYAASAVFIVMLDGRLRRPH
jgi:hypothetical protein